VERGAHGGTLGDRAYAMLAAMSQDRFAEDAVAALDSVQQQLAAAGGGQSSALAPARMSQAFEALYYPELLHRVNPRGDVGLLTLWSPWRAAKRRLDSFSPEILDDSRSRVVVISNLYGDGMYAMFCNLLFNPQVRHLIAIGEDLGLPTCREIEAFLADGLEDTELLGRPLKRIVGTDRVFPASADFDETRLRSELSFHYLGELSSASLDGDLESCLRELPLAEGATAQKRVRVEMTTSLPNERSRQPAEPAAQQVVRPRPLDCWEELVVRTLRFGRRVELSSGVRLELLNAKAVMTAPAEESAELLREYGFSLEKFREYQQQMLDPALPEDTSYTYGNRLRGYFDLGGRRIDALQVAIDTLRANPESRRAYIALWDTGGDLAQRRGASPCLVSISLRRVEGALTLTATYRSHNLLIAWLQNVYGLLAIQRHVAERVGMPAGAITVISHSLGVNPRNSGFERAQALAEGWKRDDEKDREAGKYSLREDPNGYFVVTADRANERVVAEHRFAGVLIKRYSGRRASTIAREISADMSVSLVSHAMWLGAELASKEAMLTGSGEFVDGALPEAGA
jgi:thymidylate synthase (methanogen type)